MTNTLIAISILNAMLQSMLKYMALIGQAQANGVDITPEQLRTLRQQSKDAVDRYDRSGQPPLQ